MKVPCEARIQRFDCRTGSLTRENKIAQATAVLCYRTATATKNFENVVLRLLSSSGGEEMFDLKNLGDVRSVNKRPLPSSLSQPCGPTVNFTFRSPKCQIFLSGFPGSTRIVDLARTSGRLCKEKCIPNDCSHLISLPNGKKDFVKPHETTLVLEDKNCYPPASYSKHLRKVQITGLRIRHFDRRLLRLQYLAELSFSGNRLSAVPLLGILGFLTSLDLSGNALTEWSCYALLGPAQKSLKSIKVQRNQLEAIPWNLHNFSQLESIDVSYNRLKILPPNFLECSALRNIDASHNTLMSVPAFRERFGRSFETFDVSGNPQIFWQNQHGWRSYRGYWWRSLSSSEVQENPLRYCPADPLVPSLMELAGSCLLHHKIELEPSQNVLPLELFEYISRFFYCYCGRWKSGVEAAIRFAEFRKLTPNCLRSSSATFDQAAAGGSLAKFEGIACSEPCADKARKSVFSF